MTGPYAAAARVYRELGWQGVLPVVGKKESLPSGYSGGHLNYPTDEQVEQWVAGRPGDNVALRLPDDVLGIDVDAHNGRAGLETLETWDLQVGAELPPTWSSTSRLNGSRIMFFRVPKGLRWRSDLGSKSGIEIIRQTHRYAVVWPSIHPDTQRRYEWYAPGHRPTINDAAATPPSVTDLASLPDAWVDALQLGGVGPASRPGDRDYSSDSEPEFEHDGDRVDIEAIYRDGIPVGEQQSTLFAYMCSMRARYFRKPEMIAAGMLVLQQLENETGRAPWTAEDIIDLVNRVRREYPAGPSGQHGGAQAGPAFLAWAERRRAAEERGVGVGAFTTEVPLATDLGNSIRMVIMLGDRIRYASDEQRWYVWDGRRWAPDTRNRITDLTKIVINSVREDGERLDGDERDRWLNWARDSENITRRRAMIAGAEAEPSLVITTDELDANPDLLVVRNGTLDLQTGQLRSSNRDDLCARLAEVDYDPEATAERWLGHVNLLCNGDPRLAAYLQRCVGYTLTGDVGARSFFFLEGSGSNGKNAFIEPIMMMLGSYAQTATTALLTGGDEQHPTILADLLGARLVFVDETRQGKALNVERVKALTGSKRVKARRMRQDFFEFDAQFKLWIAGNGQPTVRDPSDGVWNRMNRVVCHGKVAPAQRIDRFGDLLYREEASGILNWALEGLRGYRQLGLGVPASVTRDVQEYRDEEDFDGQFVHEYLVKTGDGNDLIPVDQAYAVYRSWAEAAGLRGQDMHNKAVFGKSLTRLGFARSVGKLNGRTTRFLQGTRWADGVTFLGAPLG